MDGVSNWQRIWLTPTWAERLEQRRAEEAEREAKEVLLADLRAELA